MRRLVRSSLLALILVDIAWPAPAIAQLQVAAVRGTVLDEAEQPLADAAIVLQDPTGTTVRSGRSRADGTFAIADVAPGAYVVRVERGGQILLTYPLVVRGSLPVDVTLSTALALRDEVLVRGDASPSAVEHPWSLAGDVIRGAPEPLPGHRLQSALAALPGWTAEDNGLLHVRGVDDGLLIVQDGIPIYERVDRLFGLSPGVAGVSSIHVLDGYIPPEFGFKSGAVIEVRSETGVRDGWSGTLDTGIGQRDTRHVTGLAAGPVSGSAGVMVTGALERSSRFLDPVDVDNFHNDGESASVSAQFTWHGPANTISASAQGGRSLYDVPNSFDQEAAGQDQRQRVSQALVSGTWQRVLTDRTVWQLAAYRRHGAATLYASPADTPVTADGRRADTRSGALWSLTHQRGRHTVKTGGEVSGLVLDERFSFAVTDPEAGEEAEFSEEALAHDPDNPFVFTDRRQPLLWSLYAQDVVRATNRLTLNFGVRFDRSRMLLTASQWSPRVGASFRARQGTVLRASVQRLFQPPQAEYLLLASSPEARELSPFEGGGSDIPPERQTSIDASISHDLSRAWRFDAAAWRRRAKDVADPNVFFGTTVTFPNSVDRQDAWGVELRLGMLPRRGWSASASYTHARVVQFGPITGGLFLEDEFLEIQDGTRFIPDHDQRHALVASGGYADARRRWRVSGTFGYQTGTPTELDDDDAEDLAERRGGSVVDVESGRVRPRAVLDLQASWTVQDSRRVQTSITGWINNAFDQTYAFNFGNPFSGTHFGARRRAGVSLGVVFNPANGG